MKLLSIHKATLLRAATLGTYNVQGEWTQPTRVSSDLLCNIQPCKAISMQKKLPEGVTDKDCREIWTKTRLFYGSDSPNQLADFIEYEGSTFEVFEVAHWNGPRKLNGFHGLLIKRDKVG